jgi:hypothetical protein
MDKRHGSGITSAKSYEDRKEKWKAIKWTISQTALSELQFCGGGGGRYGRLPTEDEQWRRCRRWKGENNDV